MKIVSFRSLLNLQAVMLQLKREPSMLLDKTILRTGGAR